MLLPYSILIAFICAAMNHMGLIAAAERVLHCKLPVLNCPKCAAFWATLGFWLVAIPGGEAPGTAAGNAPDTAAGEAPGMTTDGTVVAVAVAFAAAYMAVWMELAMGGIDRLYLMLYDKIYPTAADAADDAPAAEREEGSDAEDSRYPASYMSEVRPVGPAMDGDPLTPFRGN